MIGLSSVAHWFARRPEVGREMEADGAPARADDCRETALRVLDELIEAGDLRHVRFRLWDGSYWPSSEPRPATVVLNHPGALRAMLARGSEMAVAEAYLRDDCDVEGDVEAAFELGACLAARRHRWLKMAKALFLLRKLPGTRQSSPACRRARLRGKPHSLRRDREAVRFHYDLSNDFYATWLDSRMVYSCAYFERHEDDLETAQAQKLDYICRKLRLQPGQRFLDIGCGWGGLVLHAASRYGVSAVGITLSERQAEYARRKVQTQGLQDQVEIRVEDYRELDEPKAYDAVASVGMAEHVGRVNLPAYFGTVYRLLKPGGPFFNQAIGRGPAAWQNPDNSFIQTYVFPDSDLMHLHDLLGPAEAAGFEVRDVESLREHYALTLRHWIRRLEDRHADVRRHVDETVYRTWRLYMGGSAFGFRHGELTLYQTLLIRPSAEGASDMPLTRKYWYVSPADAEYFSNRGFDAGSFVTHSQELWARLSSLSKVPYNGPYPG